jgi:hypothetical protein
VKRRRILDGEEVTSFVWARAGGVRNDAMISVVVGSGELSRIWEGEEGSDFGWGAAVK